MSRFCSCAICLLTNVQNSLFPYNYIVFRRINKLWEEDKFLVRCSPTHVQTNLCGLKLFLVQCPSSTTIFTTRTLVKLRQIFIAFAVSLSGQELNSKKLRCLKFFFLLNFLRLLKSWKTHNSFSCSQLAVYYDLEVHNLIPVHFIHLFAWTRSCHPPTFIRPARAYAAATLIDP